MSNQLAQVVVGGDAEHPIALDLVHEVEAVDSTVDDANHLDAAELISVLRAYFATP